MSKRSFLLGLTLMLALAVSACGAAATEQATPTAAMMETEAMPATEAMMESTEAMMDGTATPDAMMESTEAMMADGTATPDGMMEATEPMMESTEAMMMDGTTTPDAMMEATEAMLPDTGGTETAMESPAWYNAGLTNARTGETFSIADFEGQVVLVETMAIWCPTCLRQQGEIQTLRAELGERDDFVTVTLDVDPNEDQADLKAYAEQNGFDWTYAVAPAEVAGEIGRLYGDQFLNPPSAPILIIDRHGVAHPLPFGLKSSADLLEAVNMYLGEM